MMLTDYINRRDFIAWPDFDTLAENCDVDRRTVIRAINEGRKLGHIVRIRPGGWVAGKGVSNRYMFRLKHVPDAPAPRDAVSGQS
jgi:DNA-binding GntR family transcriptional regulator